VTVVHQVLSGAGPHDAITTEARVFRSYFTTWGWQGRDFAYRLAPNLEPGITGATDMHVDPDDLLLLHHSAGWPALETLLALPNPKLLLYHNVTPPEWLWEHAPIVSAHCATGREQLRRLVPAATATAADSAFNAEELALYGAHDSSVIPLLLESDRLGSPVPGDGEPVGGSAPTILFVGRLSPHKRQDELIKAFALYRRHRRPDAALSLVGDPINDSYLRVLHDLANALAPGAVRIESGITNAELGDRYRSASAFVCLSEHEGFCIPVLEALRFGLPVIARPEGAVPEVAGDAAVFVSDRDPAVVAELIHLAVSDPELRAELRRRAPARLQAFAPDAIAQRLHAAVERALAIGQRSA
jgi:L-malate glycosyltransferase